MGGVFNVVNMHLYHYGANNPIKYTDPDGRFLKPVLLRGAQGTAAHNTAYNLVTAKINELGYSNVFSNSAMRSSSDKIVSGVRPDWQGFGNSEVAYWELKQGTSKGFFSAITDVAVYTAVAQSKGINVKPGEPLGVIAEMVPVQGLADTYINIYSPSPGVVIYDAFKMEKEQEIEVPDGSAAKVGITAAMVILMIILSPTGVFN